MQKPSCGIPALDHATKLELLSGIYNMKYYVDSTFVQSLRIALIAVLGLLVGACGGGGSTSASVPAADQINGVSVPPVPDAVANAATVAGVDVNSNGIRDDLDRRIASNFGTEPTLLPIATEHARRLQAAIITPTTEVRQSYIDVIRCLEDEQLLYRLSDQTRAVLDTPERRRAFAVAVRRLVISTEGC